MATGGLAAASSQIATARPRKDSPIPTATSLAARFGDRGSASAGLAASSARSSAAAASGVSTSHEGVVSRFVPERYESQ